MLKSRRLWMFLLCVALFSAVYQAGSMVEVSEEDAAAFMEEFGELVADIDALGIFVHNSTIALLMFIPGAGTAWGLLSAWSTGLAFASISAATPGAIDIHPLSILYLTPFGVLELSAYSLAMSRGLIALLILVRRQDLRSTLRATLIEVAVVVSLLLVGGYVEHRMIEMAQGLHMDGPVI